MPLPVLFEKTESVRPLFFWLLNSALVLLDMAISKLGLNPQLQRYAMQLELRRDNTKGALDRWYSLEDQLGETPEWGITLARLLILADSVDEAGLIVETVKGRLVRLRQTPARKAFQAQTATGKLKALMTPITPRGCHCSIMRCLGRSLCRVGPLIFTRTSLKPKSARTGSASAATRCAGPVSRASLVSVSVVIGALSGNKKSGPRDRDPLAISTFVAM